MVTWWRNRCVVVRWVYGGVVVRWVCGDVEVRWVWWWGDEMGVMVWR